MKNTIIENCNQFNENVKLINAPVFIDELVKAVKELVSNLNKEGVGYADLVKMKENKTIHQALKNIHTVNSYLENAFQKFVTDMTLLPEYDEFPEKSMFIGIVVKSKPWNQETFEKLRDNVLQLKERYGEWIWKEDNPAVLSVDATAEEIDLWNNWLDYWGTILNTVNVANELLDIDFGKDMEYYDIDIDID
jgi:hypothetical protein